MKKLWSGIKSIINIKKCPNSLVSALNEHNITIDNLQDIANIFNNFFVNVHKLTEKGEWRGENYKVLEVIAADLQVP